MKQQEVLKKYEDIHNEYNKILDVSTAKSNSIVLQRALSFLVFIVCLTIAIVISREETPDKTHLILFFGSSLLSLAFFTWMVSKHNTIKEKIEALNKLLQYNNDQQSKLNGTWIDLKINGIEFSNAEHMYSDDMDTFGTGSIFQLVNSCYIKNGQERLANWMLSSENPDKLILRQEAVKDLAPRLKFRHEIAKEELLLHAKDQKVRDFIEWLQQGKYEFKIKNSFFILWVLPALIGLGFLIGGLSGWELYWPWIFPLFLSWLALRSVKGKATEVFQKIDTVSEGILAYHNIFAILKEEGKTFAADELKRLQENMRSDTQEPVEKLHELASIAMAFDNRHGMIYSVMNLLLLWDIRLLMRLQKWGSQTSAKIDKWLDSLFELQALNSLASFSFHHPQYPFPKFTKQAIWEAKELGHPCIAKEKRKTNDFSLDDTCRIVIITGSNMSGKSTMLRSIGVNTILANCGAPVCANSFTLGEFDMRTSMRARDDLQKGFSYFYAELHKLKKVVNSSGEQQNPLLFLVDEMLSGTNSRERTLASLGIIRHLFQSSAIGVVATHDLFLATLSKEFSQIHNFHFTDNVIEDQIHFDYKLRKGPVQTSNALFLMRKVGIDVKIEEKDIKAFPEDKQE